MNYNETLDWLFSRLPMFQRIGQAAYKGNLQTTIDLLEMLGNPQDQFKAIHVAGTNGKGSVSHLIASILQQAGYKIGLYTSPHLKDFRERIKINGKMINEEKVIGFVEKYGHSFEPLNPSFFEMTVGMAFDYFANEKVDFAVLETGMGGRLDSTNICRPVISVITNIGHDHMQFLGDSLEKIAIEKAGIIKKNVPVVIGKKQPETQFAFERIAKEKQAPIYFAEDHIFFKEIRQEDIRIKNYEVRLDGQLNFEKLSSPLAGNYQSENLATVMQAILILIQNQIIRVSSATIKQGIEQVINNTGLSGRWQVINDKPLTICDTGHNLEGLQKVTEQIEEIKFDKLHFVFGMVNDKTPETILNILPKNATYYFCKAAIPRGMDAAILLDHALKAGFQGNYYQSVKQAYAAAIRNAGENDLVFIGGSTFVVAEII